MAGIVNFLRYSYNKYERPRLQRVESRYLAIVDLLPGEALIPKLENIEAKIETTTSQSMATQQPTSTEFLKPIFTHAGEPINAIDIDPKAKDKEKLVFSFDVTCNEITWK